MHFWGKSLLEVNSSALPFESPPALHVWAALVLEHPICPTAATPDLLIPLLGPQTTDRVKCP